MRSSAKLAGVVLAVALAVLAIYGYAAAITVTGVDKLGAGQSAVNAPPDVTDVTWVLKADDVTKVDKVQLTFSEQLIAGSDVYVQLRDNNNNIISTGHESLDQDSQTVIVDVDDVEASKVYKIDVTVIVPA